jgi:hypothetical protein
MKTYSNFSFVQTQERASINKGLQPLAVTNLFAGRFRRLAAVVLLAMISFVAHAATGMLSFGDIVIVSDLSSGNPFDPGWSWDADDDTPPTLSNGTSNRTSDTEAIIGFDTDEAGEAYCVVLPSGALAPDEDVVVNGTSLGNVSSGTVKDKNVTALTAGEKDIYVVVRDDASNISQPLKIVAAAYVPSSTDVTDAFTDANFLAAVRDLLGKDASEPVYDTDCAAEKILNVKEKNISSLAGLEYFTSLTALNCSNNELKGFNVTGLSALVTLDCSYNYMTSEADIVGLNTNLTTDFTFEPQYVAVTDISDIPTTATANVPLTLTGTVVPANATNQTIDWSLQSAGTTGATLSGSVFTATAAGTAGLRATIVNGVPPSTPYIKDFNITVNPPPTYGVSIGSFANGSVLTDKTTATEGETVTLTIEPDPGYGLESLTVDAVDVTGGVSDNSYPFAMPSHDVTVTATFDKTGDQQAVEAAKSLIEGHTYNANEATEFDENTLKAWLVTEINALLSNLTVSVSETNIAFSGDPVYASNGTDGSFTFIVTFPATPTTTGLATAPKGGVIKATPIVNAAPPVISEQPQSVTVSENTTVMLTVTASSPDGGNLTYQWYENDENSNSGGTAIDGETNSDCLLSLAIGTAYYYVEVTNENLNVTGTTTATTVSDVATVTVNALVNAEVPVIITQPSDATYDAGASADPVAVEVTPPSDGGTLSYEWYENDENSNTGGTAIAGAIADNYTPPTDVAGVYYYYVVVTNTITDNGDGGQKTATLASNVATITVVAIVDAETPVITGHPQGMTVNTGDPVTLSVTADVSDGGTLSYEWFSNTTDDNTAGTSVGTGNPYTFDASTPGTMYYFVVVTNFNGSVNGNQTVTATSRTAEVTVNDGVVNAETPTITTQPQGYTVNEGTTAPLSVVAEVTDGGTLSYQWYNNGVNSNVDGMPITGATDSNYSPPTTLTAGTYYYYVVVTNENTSATGEQRASVASTVATVTVNALVDAATPTINGHPQGATYTVDQEAAALTVTASVTDDGTLTYQWRSNTTDSNSDGTDIPDATDVSYTPPTTEVGTVYYYVVVTNTNNAVDGTKTATASSNTATITVTPSSVTNAQTPTITAQPQDATVNVDVEVSLSVTASVTDGGTLTYQWYSNMSNSNSGGTAITDATGSSYSPATATAGMVYYYVVVTNTNSSVNGAQTATIASRAAAVTVNGTVATYAVTVATSANGTVTASPSNAEAGVVIMLTIAPATGYELETLTVDGSNVTAGVSDGRYSFVMPSHNVTVSATFKKTQAQIDLEAVEAAKAAIEGGTFRIAQATGNAEAEVKIWLINTLRVLFGQSANIQFRADAVADAVITIESLTPAIAGTEATPAGTDGNFLFTVTLTQGAATVETAEVSGVIVAMPYAAIPVKNIEIVQLGETTVRLLNTGNVATGDLTLTLAGDQANLFTLATLTPGSLEVGGEADIAFTMQAGLAPGTYKATLTAMADDMTPVSAEITHTVTPTNTSPNPSDGGALRASATDGGLLVSGLTPGESLTIYNMQGQLVYKGKAAANEQMLYLNGRGVYVIVAGNRTVKAAY